MAKKKPSKREGSVPKEIKNEVAEISAKAKEVEDVIITLTPEMQKSMADWLSARVTDAITSPVWSDVKSNIGRYRENYEKGVARTATGMEGAHDYRTFIAASQADAMKSRILGIFSVDPIMKVEGRNEVGMKNQRSTELFLDYHHDENVRLAQLGDRISSYVVIEGHAVIYCPWVLEIESESRQLLERRVYINGSQTRLVDINSPIDTSKAKAEGFVPKEPPEYDVEEVVRPEVKKNYPEPKVYSLKDYINPPSTKPGETPAWEAVRESFTLDELEALESSGKMYPGSVKKLKVWLKKKVRDTSDNPDVTGGSRGTDQVSNGSGDPVDADLSDSVIYCWIIWGKQKVPGNKSLKNVATIYHHESATVLQTRFNPYIGEPSPFFHPTLMRAPWRFAGIGMMELASPGERAINDLANFVLDEGRIFSAIPFKYNKKRFTTGMSPFDFWKGVGLNSMKDFEVLSFRDRRPMDLNVSTFIRSNTERRTGQSDLQLGRESDVTGKQPPTARGIISILREGQVRFTTLNFTLVQELVRMAAHEIKLFQQLMGSKVAVNVLGEDGKNLFPEGLSRTQILGSFKFNANSPVQSMARELDAELNMLMYERMKDNPFIAKNMESFYNMTKDVLQSTGKKNIWIKPLQFYQKVAGRIPEEASSGLTPEEQAFVEKLMKAGVPMEKIKEQLQAIRANASQGQQPAERGEAQAPQAESDLLTQQE